METSWACEEMSECVSLLNCLLESPQQGAILVLCCVSEWERERERQEEVGSFEWNPTFSPHRAFDQVYTPHPNTHPHSYTV